MFNAKRILAVVAFAGCITTAAIAAESAPGSSSPTVNWTAVILALLGATSLGTRILVWCRDNAKLLRILADILEQASAGGSIEARRLKGRVENETKAAGAAVKDLAEKIAAKAEKRNDTNGGATTARRESKGRRILRAIGRWAPIVGGFI